MNQPRLTKREQELQKEQSLTSYIALVEKEARRRLGDDFVNRYGMCLNRSREIRNTGNFENDVCDIVEDSKFYAN